MIEKCEGLKPCPFCGAKANLIRGENSFYGRYWIVCNGCMRTRTFVSKDDAVNYWNNRPEDKKFSDELVRRFLEGYADAITKEVEAFIEGHNPDSLADVKEVLL